MALALISHLVFYPIVPNFILPLFHKLSPLAEGTLRTEIEQWAKRNKFPVSDLYVMDGSSTTSHSNTYFVGLPWCKQIVLFDNLVELFTVEQIVAVLAHELGHWKLNHIAQMALQTQASFAVNSVLFASFLYNESLKSSFGFSHNDSSVVGFLLFSYITWPLDLLTKWSHNLSVCRKEYQGDAYAKRQRHGKELSSALIKLNKDNLSPKDGDWLYAIFNRRHPGLVEVERPWLRDRERG